MKRVVFVVLLVLFSLSSVAQIATSLLTNRSGGDVEQYEVVVIDEANANSFTTTTEEGDGGVLGVVHSSSIANGASGVIVMYGLYDVTCTGSVSIGDYLKTSTTAGSAVSGGSSAVGTFGLALEAGSDTEIKCLLLVGSSSEITDDVSDDDLDTMQDVDAYTGQAGGDLLIWDGSDSWDNTAVGGDATLASDGTLAITKFGFTDLTDPDADRVLFWDDSEGALKHLTIGTGLALTGAELSASGTPDVDLDDDTPILFGDDDDFQMEYNSATSKLEVSDGSNVLFSLADGGTVGNVVTGNITATNGNVASGTTALYFATTGLDVDFNGTSGKVQIYKESTGNSSIDSYARNDAAEDVVMSEIFTIQEDETDGTEDGKLSFAVMQDGSMRYNAMTVAPTLVTTYGGLTAGGDIMGGDDCSVADDLITQGGICGTDGNEIELLADRDGTESLRWKLDSGDPAVALEYDATANLKVYYKAENDAAESTVYAGEYITVVDDTDGSETGMWSVALMNAGSIAYNRLKVESDGDTTIAGDAVLSSGACSLGASASAQGRLTLFEGGGANTPAWIRMYSPAGNDQYLFFDDSGNLRQHSSAPTANTDGSAVAGSGISGLTLAGDSGGGQAIGDSDTITVAGGNGITTADSATDTVTASLGPLTGNWSQTGAYDIVLANAESELKICESGGSYSVTFDVGSLSSNRAHTDMVDEDGRFVIVPSAGTADQVLQSDGDDTYSWHTPNTKAIVLTAAGGQPDDGAPCADAEVVAYSANNVWVMAFDASTDESAWWMLSLPADYGGGTFTPTFYYTVASDWADSGDKVNWAIQGMSVGNSDALSTALGAAVEVNDVWATGETTDELLVIEGGALTLSGSPAAGDFANFCVYRDADDGTNDTCTADARLIAVKLEYAEN